MPDEVQSGGGPPRDQSMEARVSAVEAPLGRLEDAVDEIRAELKALRADMTELRIDIAEMKGRMANLPTTFQLVYMQTAIIVTVFAAAVGLSLALIKFAAGH